MCGGLMCNKQWSLCAFNEGLHHEQKRGVCTRHHWTITSTSVMPKIIIHCSLL